MLNARDEATLETALQEAKGANQLTMLEVACAVGARADLGRPTTTPIQNRDALMAFFAGGKGMIALLLNSGLGSRMGDETREHPAHVPPDRTGNHHLVAGETAAAHRRDGSGGDDGASGGHADSVSGIAGQRHPLPLRP